MTRRTILIVGNKERVLKLLSIAKNHQETPRITSIKTRARLIGNKLLHRRTFSPITLDSRKVAA